MWLALSLKLDKGKLYTEIRKQNAHDFVSNGVYKQTKNNNNNNENKTKQSKNKQTNKKKPASSSCLFKQLSCFFIGQAILIFYLYDLRRRR